MRLSVFIRTYRNDFDWLPYCLERIRKHIKYHEIVIVTPHDSLLKRRLDVSDCKVVRVSEHTSGYLAQQSDKLNAWQWCESEVIMYVDSDTMFYKDVCVDDFITDGRINLLRTRYDQIETPWQTITENAIGFKSDWEYMRRFPLLYWRETLVNINRDFPSLSQYINRIKNREFSEFNFIGQFIERNEYHKYNLLDTNDGVPPEVCKQFWSYTGVTEEVIQQINAL
jgi:hypothetical protein